MLEKKQKILIVEDEPDFSEILSQRLRLRGFAVDTAPDGEAGIKAACRDLPDLILLDVMMPGLDGGEVAEVLAQRLGRKCPPIIYLTALVSSKEAERRNTVGTEETILPKTVKFEELLEVVHQKLSAKNA
jgi:DNA-binding response OmpR family regulator